jgi:hypothetical protein
MGECVSGARFAAALVAVSLLVVGAQPASADYQPGVPPEVDPGDAATSGYCKGQMFTPSTTTP